MKPRIRFSTWKSGFCILSAVAGPLLVMASEAAAHHAMGGVKPSSLWQGILSGVGHPIIGLDHFAFIIGIGLLSGVAGIGLVAPVLFVVATTAGLWLHVAGVDLPYSELLVALSVTGIGVVVWLRSEAGSGLSECLAFAAAGLFHGYAFAESIIGAETTPLADYIVGLAMTQLAIAAIAWQLSRADGTAAGSLQPRFVRLGGGLILAVGLVHIVLASVAVA